MSTYVLHIKFEINTSLFQNIYTIYLQIWYWWRILKICSYLWFNLNIFTMWILCKTNHQNVNVQLWQHMVAAALISHTVSSNYIITGCCLQLDDKSDERKIHRFVHDQVKQSCLIYILLWWNIFEIFGNWIYHKNSTSYIYLYISYMLYVNGYV